MTTEEISLIEVPAAQGGVYALVRARRAPTYREGARDTFQLLHRIDREVWRRGDLGVGALGGAVFGSMALSAILYGAIQWRVVGPPLDNLLCCAPFGFAPLGAIAGHAIASVLGGGSSAVVATFEARVMVRGRDLGALVGADVGTNVEDAPGTLILRTELETTRVAVGSDEGAAALAAAVIEHVMGR
jgi:hypothetical protein